MRLIFCLGANRRCQIALVMMRYDADMMEAADDAGRTRPSAKDRHAIDFFVRKYRARIKNSNVGFGEFAELEKDGLYG